MLVLPNPKEIDQREGSFRLMQGTHICIDHRLGPNTNTYAVLLKKEIQNVLGFQPDILRTCEEQGLRGICLIITGRGNAESYRLLIGEDGI